MKKYIFLVTLLFSALACSQTASVSTPTVEPVPQTSPTELPTAIPPEPTAEPTEVPTAVPTATTEPFPGTAVSFGNLSLVLPPGLASGISGEEVPAAVGEDLAPWDITADYIHLTLEGYALQDKFHQPQIYVFSAEQYAAHDEGAANNIAFLKTCCSAENGLVPDTMPHIPFFNAGQVFASNIQALAFQNGNGVRFVTEYAQYFATINNTDLFYQYQGLTADGQGYIIVILPITAPLLPAIADPAADVPPGGFTPPSYDDLDADWPGYYENVTALLNNMAEDTFGPTLAELDALIQSITITQ